MAINWFEGGRRINRLFVGLTVISGLAYVGFSATPSVNFSTSAPDEPWRLSTDPCDYPSQKHYLDSRDLGDGERRSVTLCFEASIEDKIPYSRAPAPPPDPNVPPSIVEITGAPPAPEQKWYYLGGPFDDNVEAYIAKRSSEFELTQERASQARASLRAIYWKSRYRAFKEAAPVVGAIIIFFWLFTAVTGWIVRGFAGVPTGKDFKE